MQLKLATDHAIRALLYMAKYSGYCYIQDIAKNMHISINDLRQTPVCLRDAGIVGAQNGRVGGCRRLKSPEEISLYDMVTTMKGTLRINRCLEPDHGCSRDAGSDCPVHRCYMKVQAALENSLRSVAIADMLCRTDDTAYAQEGG